MVEPVGPPPAEESTIVLPVRASLAPLLPLIEKEVPRTFEKEDKKSGVQIRFRAQRMPITLEMNGNAVRAQTRILYGVEACRPPLPCISCGFDEAMRATDVSLRSELSWDSRWFLRSQTVPEPPSFANRCRVTLLSIDVTEWTVAPNIEAQLREVAKTIDASTPKITDISKEAREVWTSLQTPWSLGSDTWLLFEPSDVVFGPITGSGQTLQSTLAIRAMTKVVRGERPRVAPRSLPALRSGEVPSGGIRVPVDLEMSYEEATRLLSENRQPSKDFTIESLRIVPGSGRRIAIEAMIESPNYRGPVLLEGTPTFDPATNSIVVNDLDYTLTGKRGPLFRLREKFAHEALRTRLRSMSRFTLANRLDEVRSEINRSLNRNLGSGVSLRGRVDSVAPTLIFSHDRGITIRVVAQGTAEVELAPSLPR